MLARTHLSGSFDTFTTCPPGEGYGDIAALYIRRSISKYRRTRTKAASVAVLTSRKPLKIKITSIINWTSSAILH